jgi:hypothetical protein
MDPMTLLDKARSKRLKSVISASDDEVDLAIAFFNHKITSSQAAFALGRTGPGAATTAYVKLAGILRSAASDGRVSIRRKNT